MNFWRITWGLVALACLVGVGLLVPAQAQDTTGKKDEKKDEKKAEGSGDAVDFLKAFKAFTPDKEKPKFYQKLVTKTVQEMKVEKQNQPAMKQTQDQTFVIQWTPKDKKDGKYIVEQQIVYVKMDIMIGSTSIAYDSNAKEQPKNPMTEFFESLMSVTLTLSIDEKDLKVTKVEGGNKFVDKLGESHPQMKSLLKSILSDEALMKMSQQTWAAIPTTPKKVGETWSTESDLALGAIGMYKNKYEYKFDAVETKDKEKLAKITVTPSMSYVPPKDKSGEQLPFDINKESTLKSVAGAESTGTVYFDLDKGRIASSTMKMKVEGNVIIVIGGTETNVKLEQTQSSQLNTYEKLEEALPPKK